MSLEAILKEVRALSPAERRQLIEALTTINAEEPPPPPKKRRLRDFRGVGAPFADGTDAQEALATLRDEWDAPR